MKQDLTNKFFDINKLPGQWGIVVIWVSMSRIANAQNGEQCFRDDVFVCNKRTTPQVGVNIVYTDGVYMHSDKKANVLQTAYLHEISKHKNAYLKVLIKSKDWVKEGVSFSSWNQYILGCPEFTSYLGEIRKLYSKDKFFKECIVKDAQWVGRKLTENQLNIMLEEILMDYLTVKGKVEFYNEFVQHREKWVLNCYHGKPYKSLIYLHQLNPLKLENSQNKYQNSWYDLEEKKLYDFHRIDLKTIKLYD